MAEQVDRQLTLHDHVVLAFDDGSVAMKLTTTHQHTGEPDELTLTMRDPFEAIELGYALQRAAAIAEAYFDADADDGDDAKVA